MFRASFDENPAQKTTSANEPLKVNVNFGDLAVANTAVSVQTVLWAITDESGQFNTACLAVTPNSLSRSLIPNRPSCSMACESMASIN